MAILDMHGREDVADDHWTASRLGQRLLRESRPVLDALVRRMHGDTLLWCGQHGESLGALQRSIVRNRFFLGDKILDVPEGIVRLVAEPSRLPFANNSMDGVVLHHSLEPLSDPRDALREMVRVLHPGGRLVIAAFNPWSLLGLRRLYARVRADRFSDLRFVNPVRLLDWLRLLGLELEEPVRFRSTGLPFDWRRGQPGTSQAANREGLEPDGNIEGSAPVQLTGGARRNALPGPRRERGIEIPLGDVFLLSAVKQAFYVRGRRLPSVAPRARLAGVAFPKASARLIPVDFRGDRR